MQKENHYIVYILECADGSYYTGITTDIKRRLLQHREGTGAKYTRGRAPLHLRFIEGKMNHSKALQREREIKGMTRQQKIQLIAERGNLYEEAKKF
ncbi:putative endonuclease [Marininema mesophilum]|uniref:Putative endonuclease n=1 Tax=Marininema mesophilum TaxID=1048340 RepID=A0A1H2WY04_9BACL|nr:GIY-YIG nuclease family protein [Marininema mesophilum]SDW85396.1 putative endonuclease [Marininema mesophilum]